MILRDVHPQDVSVEPFKTFKRFTFTHTDSGSGVFALKANSGSFRAFYSSSALSQSIGEFNQISQSLGKDKSTWYSGGTFYNLPTYYMLNHKFYERFSNRAKFKNHTNQVQPFLSYGPSNTNLNFRELHDSASLITIPQQLIGEEIKPKSITITDNSTDATKILVDDGLGNIYDNAYSSSFAVASESFGPEGSSITGSIIGNVMYGQGLIVITETGSYNRVGSTSGSDGWSVSFKSTQTIYEREIFCNVERGEFLGLKNPTAYPGNSGSFFIPEGLFSGSYSTGHRNISTLFPASSSFKTKEVTDPTSGETYLTNKEYVGTGSYQDFVTGSNFAPYITTIGLYDETNDLLAVGRLAKPIKNDKELDISFLLRFDV